MNRSLIGDLVNISIVQSFPHTTLPLNLELLKALQYSLEFKYILKEAGDWGHLDNETGKWSGMIGHLVDGEAEFTITDAADTKLRRAVVDFSLPFIYFKHVAMYHKQSFTGDNLGLIRPFKGTLWVAILFWGVCLGSIMFLPQVLSRLRLQKQNNSSFDFKEIYSPAELEKTSFLLLPFSILCKQAVSTMPQASYYKIVVYSGFVVGIVLSTAFSAVLVSLLSVANHETTLTYDSGVTFVFDPTDDRPELIEELLAASRTTRFHEDYRKNAKLSVNVRASTTKRNILHGSWVYLGTEWTVNEVFRENYTTNEYCSIGVSGLPMDSQRLSIMIRKNSPYIRLIDNAILKVLESGLNQVWIKRYCKPMMGPLCNSIGGYDPIGLTSVMVAIYALVCGACVSFLVLAIELLLARTY